jgi:hypothetical protein
VFINVPESRETTKAAYPCPTFCLRSIRKKRREERTERVFGVDSG